MITPTVNWPTPIDSKSDSDIGQPTQEQAKQVAAADPWVNRAAGLICKTCIWYSPKASIVTLQGGVPKIGRCRRHAPTMGGYPVVYMTDWCGDHRLDENKI